MKSLLAILGVFLASIALGAEPKSPAGFWERSVQWREFSIPDEEGQIRRIDAYLKTVKQAAVNKREYENGTRSVNGRLLFPTAKAKTAAIDAAQVERDERSRRVKLMREGKGYPMPKLERRFSVGNFGYVGSIDVKQVISATEFRGEVLLDDVPVWVSGVPTTKLVDDARLNTDGLVFEIAGTKSYTSVVGAKQTVFELRPIDVDTLKGELGAGEELFPTWKPWEQP